MQLLIALLHLRIIVGFVWLFVLPSSCFYLPFMISLLTSSVGISTGLLISSSARSEVSAISTVPIVLIPQLLLGGYIKIYGRLQLDSFQHFAADCMPIRWSFEALSTVEYAKVRELNTSLHAIGSTGGFEQGVGVSCVVIGMTVPLLMKLDSTQTVSVVDIIPHSPWLQASLVSASIGAQPHLRLLLPSGPFDLPRIQRLAAARLRTNQPDPIALAKTSLSSNAARR